MNSQARYREVPESEKTRYASENEEGEDHFFLGENL